MEILLILSYHAVGLLDIVYREKSITVPVFRRTMQHSKRTGVGISVYLHDNLQSFDDSPKVLHLSFALPYPTIVCSMVGQMLRWWDKLRAFNHIRIGCFDEHDMRVIFKPWIVYCTLPAAQNIHRICWLLFEELYNLDKTRNTGSESTRTLSFQKPLLKADVKLSLISHAKLAWIIRFKCSGNQNLAIPRNSLTRIGGLSIFFLSFSDILFDPSKGGGGKSNLQEIKWLNVF